MGEMLLFYCDCAIWTIESVPRFFLARCTAEWWAPSTEQIGLVLSWEILVHCREVVRQVTGYLGMHWAGKILVHALCICQEQQRTKLQVMWWCSAMQRAEIFLGTLSMVQTVCMPAAVYIACHRNLLLTKVLCWQHYTTTTHFSWQSTCVTYIWIRAMTVVETQFIFDKAIKLIAFFKIFLHISIQ